MTVNSNGAPTSTNLDDHRNDYNNDTNIQNKDSHNLNSYSIYFNGPIYFIPKDVNPGGTNTFQSQTAQGTGLDYSQKNPDDAPSKSDSCYSPSSDKPHNDDALAPSYSRGDHGSTVCCDENRPDEGVEDEEWQDLAGEWKGLAVEWRDFAEEWQDLARECQGQDLDDIAGTTSHLRGVRGLLGLSWLW